MDAAAHLANDWTACKKLDWAGMKVCHAKLIYHSDRGAPVTVQSTLAMQDLFSHGP